MIKITSYKSMEYVTIYWYTDKWHDISLFNIIKTFWIHNNKLYMINTYQFFSFIIKSNSDDFFVFLLGLFKIVQLLYHYFYLYHFEKFHQLAFLSCDH